MVNLVLSQTWSAYKFTSQKKKQKKRAETGEIGGQSNKTFTRP